MSEMQRKFYKSLLQKDIDVIQAGNDRSRLLNVVMQLRKASPPPCPCGAAAPLARYPERLPWPFPRSAATTRTCLRARSRGRPTSLAST